jgi:hypothetical protein
VHPPEGGAGATEAGSRLITRAVIRFENADTYRVSQLITIMKWCVQNKILVLWGWEDI